MRLRVSAAALPVLLAVIAVLGAGAARASYRIDTGGWEEMPELPAAVSGHCAVSVRDALLVLGGRDAGGKPVSNVYRAKIKRGSFKKWGETMALPVPVSDHAAGVLAGRLWVTGGMERRDKEIRMTGGVWSAGVGDDGAISSWRREAELPEPIYGHGQACYGRWVYVVGGMSSGACRQDVLRGDAGSGRIKEWEPALSLPQPLTYAAAIVVDRYLLVIGGQSSGTGKSLVLPTVYVGPIWDDGSITTWYLASSKLPGAWMGFGRCQTAAWAYEDSLFCFGGQDSLWFMLENVAAATVDRERGEMGQWGVFPAPPGMPAVTAVAGWQKYFYLTGGMAGGRASGKVLRGTLKRNKE